MQAIITAIHPAAGQTIWTGEATLDDGRRCLFAGDWRPMFNLAEEFGITNLDLPTDLDDWQILRWLPQPVASSAGEELELGRWADDGGPVA